MNRTYGIVGGILLLVGLGMVGGGLFFTLQEDARLSPSAQTNGTVVAAAVEPVPGEDAYRPNVTYRYAVDGRTYTSSSVYPPTLDARGGERSWAEEVVAEYETGQTVTVTYSTDRPTESYVRERRSVTPIIGFGLGLATLAMGFLFSVAAIQADREFVQDPEGMVTGPPDQDPDDGSRDGDGSTAGDGDGTENEASERDGESEPAAGSGRE